MKKTNITVIVATKLCCSCGGCVWACPKKAISFVETVGGYLLPSIDRAACTECGTCLSICPGKGLVEEVINSLPEDPFVGICLQAYVGKATDSTLYANSQSGGIVSALLAHALESGEIGAAVTVVMVAGNPPRPHVRLARNIKEIKHAQKSKYAPVPLLLALEDIAGLNKPVAIVGVACQIHGFLNILERFPHLKGQIKYKIGLVCDRIMTYRAMDFLIKKAGLVHSEKIMFHFRDKACSGYPGNVHVISPCGDSVSLPSSARMQIKDFFTPARCRLCFDKMNVFSDIVVCDPHGIEGIDRTNGESAAIIRTEAGRRLFESASTRAILNAREIKCSDILDGQKINKKRIEWRGYIETWGKLDRPLPNFTEKIQERLFPMQPRKSSKIGKSIRLMFSRVEEGRFIKSLNNSIQLDTYCNKDDLFLFADNQLKTKIFYNRVLFPFRYVFHLLRKVLNSHKSRK